MQYFIEQYRDIRKSPATAYFSKRPNLLSALQNALKNTRDNPNLKTIAVWKITLKPIVFTV